MLNKNNEILQIILLLSIIFIVFLIPLAHSTYYFGYDPFFYLMMSKEVIYTGNISPAYNHPPLYPTIFANLSILSGIDVFYLIRYSLPFIIIFLGISMYLFTKEIIKNHEIALLATTFICLSSGYNSHWFYQFHVNFLEHRPAYLCWIFNILFLYSLSKYLKSSNKNKLNFLIPGIFLAASFFTYYFSGLFGALIFVATPIILLIKTKNFKKIIKLFLPIFLVTFSIFFPFFLLNLGSILEIIEIEKPVILKAREPLDYFIFLGVPAVLAILGFLYAIYKKKYLIPVTLFIIIMLYAQTYWIPTQNKLHLTELAIRELKIPTAFFAALAIFLIYKKLKKLRIARLTITTILILLSCVPAFYGILKTPPFTYTDKIPIYALNWLKEQPQGAFVSDELTTMFAYDFSGKNLIAGMYPKAGNFSLRREHQKYLKKELEEKRMINQEANEIIKNYDIQYFMLNFTLWGRIKREIEYNPNWSKQYDSDEAAIFLNNQNQYK